MIEGINDVELEKILVRVKKMMAIAADPRAHDGDRENALRMAHNILKKYNLDMADVSAVKDGGRYTPETRSQVVVELDGRDWARGLCSEMARMNFCGMMYTPKRVMKNGQWVLSKRFDYCFIGTKANAITASLFAKEFVESTYKEYSRLKKPKGRAYARSFAMGVWTILYQRITDMLTEDRLEPKMENILQIEETLNKEVVTALSKPAAPRKRKDVDLDGFLAGKEHGGKLPLARRVSGAFEK